MTREIASRRIGSRRVVVVQGDLTAQGVDVIVNAANERLAHGGGVAAAIARAAGPQLQEESDRWVAEHGPVGPGEAAVTTAGSMPARLVVHVVGPRHRPGQDNEGLLRQAVRAALDRARDEGARSVALPAISAGIFGYPPAEAARVIGDSVAAWLDEAVGSVTEVRLVGYDAAAAERFAAAI